MNIDVLRTCPPQNRLLRGICLRSACLPPESIPFWSSGGFTRPTTAYWRHSPPGASAGLSSPCRPSMARASGLRPCCPPTCWGAIPICGSPSPPIRLRWLRSSTGACSVSSIRPNMRPFSRKRPSSGEPGLRSTCVRLMRWRSSVTGGGLLSVGREGGAHGATVWTASFSTTFYRKIIKNLSQTKLMNEKIALFFNLKFFMYKGKTPHFFSALSP